MKQSVTDGALKQRGAGVRNMMMMEDSAKLTKGILTVNYMRVAALMVYAALAQLAERRTVNAYVPGSSPGCSASRHKEDAEFRRIQFNNVVIALTQVTSFICRGSTIGSATHL